MKIKEQLFFLITFLIFFLIKISVLAQQNLSRGNYSGNFTKFLESERTYGSSFLLTNVTFASDVPLSQEEFFYLTELKPNTFISRKQVDYAFHALMNKKRFSSINIDISDDSVGKKLHFILVGNWIFKKLDFRGILFGKQKYTSLYVQQPGDVFDSTLHEESLKSIKNSFYDQGYFESIVNDELIYEKKHKTITAKIKIKRGKRFLITQAKLLLNNINKNIFYKRYNIKKLENNLSKIFCSGVINTYYSKDYINKLLKKIKDILKKKGFLRSQISISYTALRNPPRVSLTCVIKLGQKRDITFKGSTIFTNKQIKQDIIGLDQPDWLFSPDVISEQLHYEYYKKGFWSPSATFKKYKDDGYLFSINEGHPVIIDNIEIKDSVTKLPEYCPISNKDIVGKRFDLVILDKLTEDLKNFYLAHGFWDIKLDDKKFIKNPDTDAYTILLFINKGKQRLWGGLSIKGFKELEQNNFLKKYVIFSDQQVVPFDPRWVSEQRAFLLDYFHKQGYWYVDIQPDIQLQPLPPLFIGKIQQERVRCVLTWNIMLGEKVSFGKIFLRGDTKVPFKTILNELKFKEGDFLNKEKIDLTRKKLKRLDVFKTVRIQPYQLTKSKSKKPIAITLVDDDPLELRLRAGFFLTSKNFMFKRQSTPKAGASFIIRNPISSADKLAIDADWTLFERMINVDYQRPSFFSYPFMSKFKGYAGKYIHPVRVGSSDSAYESLQSGLLVGLSDEYKNDYHWGINLGNEWLKTCRIRGYLKLDDTMINIAVPYLFLEPTLVIDKLDDRINTRKGSLSVMSLKMMVPEDRGIVTARLMAEQSFFYPFYKNIIGAFHVRLGYIFRRQFNQIMPIERFYLGGPNSVRGYEIESLPPLGVTITAKNNDLIYKKEFTCQDDRIVKEKEKELLTELSISHPGTNFNVTQDYTIQGGSSMINGSFELRIPIFSPLGFVVFQDIGVLSQSGLAGFKGIWYPTSGFGFRYKTPIGAIRFDIGWKWKHRFTSDHSHPYAWYLTIGESF